MRRGLFRLNSPIPALGIAMAGILGAAAVVRGLFDPDLFWHLATGRLILAEGRVPTTDPFSFTWFGERWIPDQWLSEILLAAGFDGVGPALMLILFGFLAALALALIAEAMRREGGRLIAIIPFMLLAGAILLPQVTTRPQVISLPLLGGLLAILIRARPESSRWLYALPLLFLIWANTHGFFIVGLAAGFVYLIATVLGRTPMAERPGVVLVIGMLSVGATMVTPQGPGGLLYALSFGDANDWGAQNIAEWQSPNFHDPQVLPLLILIGAMLIFGLRRSPGWLSVLAVGGLAMGLVAIRTIGVSALLLLPALIASASAAAPTGDRRSPDSARRWLEVGAASVVAGVLIAAALSGGPIRVDDRHLPVAGVKVLAETYPDARVLARYGWGGYVINELYSSGGRVFVDGRMHKYAPQVLDDYLAITSADSGWERLVNGYGVEAMLLRADEILTKGIAQRAGWCEEYRDQLQVLMMRSCRTGSAEAMPLDRRSP